MMDDANVPSLLSLSLLGFVSEEDAIYQNTRKLVWSRDNPYFFSGPRGTGIGGPHVSDDNKATINTHLQIGLSYAWPMSQIVRVGK